MFGDKVPEPDLTFAEDDMLVVVRQGRTAARTTATVSSSTPTRACIDQDGQFDPDQGMFGPFLEVEMSKKCTLLWREAHFQVKMYKTHHVRTTFGSSEVEKVHAVVARITFPSQKCQKL